MGIELIDNEDPSVVRRNLNRLGDVRNEVRFRASIADAGGKLFSSRHLEVGDQALCAVTNVLVFLAFELADLASYPRLHWFCWRGAFERLDAGLFI